MTSGTILALWPEVVTALRMLATSVFLCQPRSHTIGGEGLAWE
jgi:hypothetical protein